MGYPKDYRPTMSAQDRRAVDLMTPLTEAYCLQGAWNVIVDGVVVAAEFNSKGAAMAAIPVERERRLRKERKKIAPISLEQK